MKKILNITVLFLILSLMCACTAQTNRFMSYDSNRYVKLCDYGNLEVNKDYIKISSDDIKILLKWNCQPMRHMWKLQTETRLNQMI